MAKKEKQTTKKKSTKKELKEELEKSVAALKTQCKDAAFFKSTMDRILSLKGQIDTEAVRLMVKENDVLREYKGDTFYVAITKQGALLHTYGGYSVFVSNRNYNSLYETLAYIVDDMEEALNDTALPEEDRKSLETDMMAKMHILLAPTWCFGSVEATYEIATKVLHELNAMVERAEELPLQEEDDKANADFEDAVTASESIGKRLEEERQ
jgi:hypothetical protein